MDREAAAGLSGTTLFSGIAPDDLVQDVLRLGGVRRSAPAGRLLLSAGEPYDRLVFVISGRLLATIDEEGGRSLLVAELRAPDAVAPGILFAPDPRLPVSLTAASSCELLIVRRDAVLGLCRRRERFLVNLLSLQGSRIQGLAAALSAARWSTLRTRLAAYLLEQSAAGAARGAGGSFRLPHTREEIAWRLGAERPSVSRSLSVMGREGLIARRGKEVRIVDRRGLERAAQGQ